jgi:UDP-GlcNAc:undecaprenyl-phosphate/decaprenyl-phosphate GlcNAc-1-phosphate transferase
MMSSASDWVLVKAGLGLAVAAFVLSWLFCAGARRFALRFGFLDRPGGHKGHQAPVPLGGGVAIWLATMIVLGACGLAVLIRGPELTRPMAEHVTAGGLFSRAGELLRILILASIIMVMGLIDDRKSLKWQLRLGIQVLCAVILAGSGIRVTLFWPFTHPLLGGTVTVMWIVGLTNSFNMLDNMDGLAASVGLIAAALFCVGQVVVGSLFAPAVLLIVIGALGGFLVHNHAPARLYMGDAGSNFLGFLLGAMTVVGTYHVSGVDSPFSVLAPLLVMAVPLYDTTSVVLIRLLEGRSPFQGDRRHFSHRLVARGLTPPQAVWTIDLVTLAGGLGALLLHRLDAWGAGLVMAQTACLLGVVAILELARSGPRAGQSQGQEPGEMKARA